MSKFEHFVKCDKSHVYKVTPEALRHYNIENGEIVESWLAGKMNCFSEKPFNYELANICNISPGDTVKHNGILKTVCSDDILHSRFMGITLFGDSYSLGYEHVKRYIMAKTREGSLGSPNIYEEMNKAGVKINNWCSDLHVPVCKESTEILNRPEFSIHKKNATVFNCSMDNVPYYDIPFAHKPKNQSWIVRDGLPSSL